jgi:hypothetical protein
MIRLASCGVVVMAIMACAPQPPSESANASVITPAE